MKISQPTLMLAASVVGDIAADKRSRGIHPPYALLSEIHAATEAALKALADDGVLTRQLAGVNRIPAFDIPAAALDPATAGSN